MKKKFKMCLWSHTHAAQQCILKENKSTGAKKVGAEWEREGERERGGRDQR